MKYHRTFYPGVLTFYLIGAKEYGAKIVSGARAVHRTFFPLEGILRYPTMSALILCVHIHYIVRGISGADLGGVRCVRTNPPFY